MMSDATRKLLDYLIPCCNLKAQFGDGGWEILAKLIAAVEAEKQDG